MTTEAKSMSEETIQVSVIVENKKVTLEGPESFVRTEVQRITDILAGASPHRATPAASGPPSGAPGAQTERDFVAEKKPKGHEQHVAVLAYWLRENGTPEFREDDMKRAYIRAGARPPKSVGQALRDARNNKDFIEYGEERGTYRLSSHGERTVLFDLPPRENR
jgi:hypothetical protein